MILVTAEAVKQTSMELIVCFGLGIPSIHTDMTLAKDMLIIVIIIYPLTARVVGAPQMILQPVFSIFPCSPLPSGTCRTLGLSIP